MRGYYIFNNPLKLRYCDFTIGNMSPWAPDVEGAIKYHKLATLRQMNEHLNALTALQNQIDQAQNIIVKDATQYK